MAAGLGFKTFTTGEVLTAGDVNGYLMQGVLVFATEAARNSAITSPQEGQFAFTKDTNSTWYYDGAAWVASGASGDVTGVTAGNGISVTNPTGPVPTVAIDTAVTVDKTTAQTLTNKTLTSPALTTPTISTLTTNGDLLYGTGSGAISRIGIGSTSQVLTVTAGVPAWATPASGGMTVLASGNLTGGVTTTISSISGSYYNLLLVVRNYKPNNDGDSLCCRVNSDATANRHAQLSVGSGGPNTFNGTYWLMDNGQDDTVNGYTAYVQFNDYANTTTWKTSNVWSSAVNAGTPTQYVNWNRWSTYNQVDAITSLQLFSTVSNTPNAGSYILYGVK